MVYVNCDRCGCEFKEQFQQNLQFILSDGIYLSDNKDDKIVIEIYDSSIDFDQIIQGEIESFKSDYHICNNCKNIEEKIDIEY